MPFSMKQVHRRIAHFCVRGQRERRKKATRPTIHKTYIEYVCSTLQYIEHHCVYGCVRRHHSCRDGCWLVRTTNAAMYSKLRALMHIIWFYMYRAMIVCAIKFCARQNTLTETFRALTSAHTHSVAFMAYSTLLICV